MREVERLTIAGTMAGQRQTSEWGMEVEKKVGSGFRVNRQIVTVRHGYL